VPETTALAVAIQPATLIRQENWQPVANIINEFLKEKMPGFTVADFEEISLIFYMPPDRPPQHGPAVRTVLHVDLSVNLRERLAKPLPEHNGTEADGRIRFIDAQAISLGGLNEESMKSGYATFGDDTLVVDTLGELRKLVANPPRPRTVDANAPGQVYAFANSAVVKTSVLGPLVNSPVYMPFAPLANETRGFRATADLTNPVKFTLTADCLTPAATEPVANTLDAALTLCRNILQQQQQTLAQAGGRIAPEEMAVMQRWLKMGNDLLSQGNRAVRRDQEVTLSASAPFDAAAAIKDLLPAVQAARAAARRTQSANNLRHIALGMLQYESAKRRLPPAVLLGPDGKTPHSWRVAILPYLGYNELYERYRLDEPWDSEHNRDLIKLMPPIYRSPFDVAASTNTSYFVFTGPDTIFFNNEGASFAQIPDGTANTILTVEAKREIPWTKPEDIPYAADQPLPKLGGWMPDGGFNYGHCDGSVFAMPGAPNEQLLRAKITRNGREIVPR
jgi:hypothetical protein